MSSLLNVFNISSSAMSSQSQRLNTVASNLANVDSATSANGQPYKAKQVIFEAAQVGTSGHQGVKVKQVIEDQAPPRMVHEPANPLADKDGYVAMPNVNATQEMVNMISTSRSYQNNVETMNAAKAMLQRTLTIGQN
ncbi:flagellar basal body rod protein FlgC [Polynucleobacter sp. AP-Feld-500C-C5]|jgi:flagellar basal-body rod protein FlgC|uniref:flagellar basal body rod protein FlgC n=1 Tax=Polynucleobacter sp. AP-Feld-500C-C5 TaxID=2576924 RepID=UPI001C0CAF44|nr:flagellar basal body rod protein FlgC [Polynucleobacter sp. AP-Feld-500C-C5]MBU3633130.1 flagellar basal body rod protein FlgC [Polynucleobacter sp. AP-Feld-500C-C5]